MLEGVLPIFKPKGMTSHDVVAKVRRIIKERRVGHTGTLDPSVEGVLPLCIGRATRIVEYLQEMNKTYHATMRIGISTQTEDADGDIVQQVDQATIQITDAHIEAVITSMIGEQLQTPPMFSAVKINGRKLYELAREGVEIERTPRLVTIYSIADLVITRPLDDYPTISFSVRCSKGTYIRTLCADIGAKLGYPAHMSQLLRTESAGFTLKEAITFETLTALAEREQVESALVKTVDALLHWPRFHVSDAAARLILNGRVLYTSTLIPATETPPPLFLLFHETTFLGICRYEDGKGVIAVKIWRDLEE